VETGECCVVIGESKGVIVTGGKARLLWVSDISTTNYLRVDLHLVGAW
jgi:hypothetical protein